jgi:hypothetical protein
MLSILRSPHPFKDLTVSNAVAQSGDEQAWL